MTNQATVKTGTARTPFIANRHSIDRKIRREMIKVAKSRGSNKRSLVEQLIRFTEDVQDYFDGLAFGAESDPFADESPIRGISNGQPLTVLQYLKAHPRGQVRKVFGARWPTMFSELMFCENVIFLTIPEADEVERSLELHGDYDPEEARIERQAKEEEGMRRWDFIQQFGRVA